MARTLRTWGLAGTVVLLSGCMALANPVAARVLGLESETSLGARLDVQQVIEALSRDGIATPGAGVAPEDGLLQPVEPEIETLLIYYSGPLSLDEDGMPILLDSAGLRLDDVIARLSEGGQTLVLALEDCFAMDGTRSILAGARIPDNAAAVTVMASAGPDGICAPGLRRVTERIASGNPGRGGEIWVQRSQATNQAQAGLLNLGVWSALALGPDAEVLQAWATEDPAIQVEEEYRLVRYDPNDPAPIFEWSAGGVRIPPGAGAVDAVLVRRSVPDPIIALPPQDRPQPSILIGLLPEEAERPEDSAPLYSDRVARDALRIRDPATFRLLLVAGSLDPPTDPSTARDELIRQNPQRFTSRSEDPNFDSPAILRALALQTELAAMNCYNSGLDGAWGPGSRRGAQAYLGQRDLSIDVAASVGLWREVIANDPVKCPAPVVAAAPRATPSARRTTNTARQPARTSKPAAPAAAPAKPAQKKRPVSIPFN